MPNILDWKVSDLRSGQLLLSTAKYPANIIND